MVEMVNFNTITFSQFSDLVDRKWVELPKSLDLSMTNAPFVIKDVVPKGTGDTRRYAEALSRTQYAPIRDEGSEADQAEIQYGYEKDAQTYTVALAVSISKHMRDTGKDRQIWERVTDLATVCPSTMDIDLAHRFTFAWSTSYTRSLGNKSSTITITMGDGLAMISTAHTLTGSATTYSTQITGNPQFSKGALETAEKSFVENTYDNLGIKMAAMPTVILTGDDPNTCNQVAELMNATANVDTSNPGTFNVYRSKYTHVRSSRIATTGTGAPDSTKAKYWFLIDPKLSSMYLGILNQPYLKTPTDGNNGESFLSENWNYMAVADYLVCVVAARFVRGSKGDGSA